MESNPQKGTKEPLAAKWIHFTAPAGTWNYEKAVSRPQREKLRRAGLTSFIAIVVLFTPLLLLQQASGNLITQFAIIILVAMACIALIFNRLGKQTLAALLLILTMDIVIEGSLISAGSLSTGWLLTFDLFVIPLITVGVLLSRRYVLIFLFLHVVCILSDFYLMPHSQDLQLLIHVWHGPAIAFARPLIIQIGTAVLAYVSVRSTDEAIIRAEKAEFVTKLQEQIRQEKQALEFGINEIIRILANAANGNYAIQTQLPRENILWQVIHALNTLFSRLKNTKQNELKLYHTEQEVLRLLQSIHAAKQGLPPIWPEPTGGVLDPLLRELRGETVSSPSSSSQISPLLPLSPPQMEAGRFGPRTVHTKEAWLQQGRKPPQTQTLHGEETWSQQGRKPPQTLHGEETWSQQGGKS
jgi:hypothetical protein